MALLFCLFVSADIVSRSAPLVVKCNLYLVEGVKRLIACGYVALLVEVSVVLQIALLS